MRKLKRRTILEKEPLHLVDSLSLGDYLEILTNQLVSIVTYFLLLIFFFWL